MKLKDANDKGGDDSVCCADHSWAKGTHTLVVSRKRVTGSRFDVQFSDLGARYPFGFAAFDNAQVRHATPDDTLFLVFGKQVRGADEGREGEHRPGARGAGRALSSSAPHKPGSPAARAAPT